MSTFAEALVAARRNGARIALPAGAPANMEEAFAVQDIIVAALDSQIIGWKVIEMPSQEVIFAPILASGLVPLDGVWTPGGEQPAGIELEIAFQMGRDVSPGASTDEIMSAIGSAHVVFELCQSRFVEPDALPQHLKLADCILNAGLVIGPKIEGWAKKDLKGIAGRLLVDGKVHKEGASVDPVRAFQVLAPALAERGKKLAKGQTVITGSLIGMNWLKGKHQLKGVIDGCGEVSIRLDA